MANGKPTDTILRILVVEKIKPKIRQKRSQAFDQDTAQHEDLGPTPSQSASPKDGTKAASLVQRSKIRA